MSTNFNRRRGAKAWKPHKVRQCDAMWQGQQCRAAVRPDHNGNRCEEHRK